MGGDIHRLHVGHLQDTLSRGCQTFTARTAASLKGYRGEGSLHQRRTLARRGISPRGASVQSLSLMSKISRHVRRSRMVCARLATSVLHTSPKRHRVNGLRGCTHWRDGRPTGHDEFARLEGPPPNHRLATVVTRSLSRRCDFFQDGPRRRLSCRRARCEIIEEGNPDEFCRGEGPGVSGMSEDGSVSRWLEGLRAGDAADIERLWDRYFHRLVALAGARLPEPCPPGAATRRTWR